MSVITDSGPLIAFAKIDQLVLVEQIFTEILIPPVVQSELLAKIGPETTRLNAALDSFIQVTQTPEIPAIVKTATFRLGPGEQQAIALAYHQKTPLLIDDRLGRRAAKQLNIKLSGTAGVLIQAKKLGHIPAVRPLLEEMRRQGYWLSDELVNAASKLAGES